MAEHSAGTPIWVDLQTSDLDAARNFYRQIFGWESQVGGPETGGYAMFTSDGKNVAGGMTRQNEQQPPAWTTYISSDSADATAEKITENGGQVFLGPMDVMDAGRMLVAADSGGAVFGVWQPGQHKGADVFNVTNALGWNELATKDLAGAHKFYGAVFGWGENTHKSPEGDPQYTEWQLGGRSIGGAMPMGPMYPPNVPPHWLPYFAVANIEGSVSKVKELGGNVLVPPTKIEPGTFSVVTDPQGAAFAIIEIQQQA